MARYVFANGHRARPLNSVVRCHLGQKLPPRQLELYRAIDEILWRDWDPIGIAAMDGTPRDEYQGYLPQAFMFALRGDEAGLVAFLHSAASGNMGIFSSKLEHHRPTAAKIMEARARISPEESK